MSPRTDRGSSRNLNQVLPIILGAKSEDVIQATFNRLKELPDKKDFNSLSKLIPDDDPKLMTPQQNKNMNSKKPYDFTLDLDAIGNEHKRGQLLTKAGMDSEGKEEEIL